MVLRLGQDIYVFDSLPLTFIRLAELAQKAAQPDTPHTKVEVVLGMSPGRWTELRVDIMDDFRIDLHDEREDRSYG